MPLRLLLLNFILFSGNANGPAGFALICFYQDNILICMLSLYKLASCGY